jgi:IS605 OrfB family transposase
MGTVTRARTPGAASQSSRVLSDPAASVLVVEHGAPLERTSPTVTCAYRYANEAKGQLAPWWAECSKEAYATGLDQLARALRNWSDSRSGRRMGPRVGFPRFKSRRRSASSVRFTTGTIRVESDRRHVTLPRLGMIKTHESTRKLQRRLADGRARILSATVRAEAGRWFVSFTVEIQRAKRTPTRPHAVVGIDLGIKTLAVFSDGRHPVQNPKHYDRALRKLARLSRMVSRKQGPDRRTGQRPSNRWHRANAARNRLHYRTAGLRRDAIHKLTTALAREYGTIVVEDLNVAGMVRNRRLARAISDAGFAEIRRQLAYKTSWNGGTLAVADRWYPSSKTCSGCGAVKAKLRLSERDFVCGDCGLFLDRDKNAALNLASLVGRIVAGSGPETETDVEPTLRPGLAGLVAVKRLPCPGRSPSGSDGDLRPATGESLRSAEILVNGIDAAVAGRSSKVGCAGPSGTREGLERTNERF